VADDPFFKTKAEWAKHDAKLLRISRKRQRISGLEAVLQMHEKTTFARQDLPYIKQLRGRIEKAKRDLKNMVGA
jgi:hypothetical protein